MSTRYIPTEDPSGTERRTKDGVDNSNLIYHDLVQDTTVYIMERMMVPWYQIIVIFVVYPWNRLNMKFARCAFCAKIHAIYCYITWYCDITDYNLMVIYAGIYRYVISQLARQVAAYQ